MVPKFPSDSIPQLPFPQGKKPAENTKNKQSGTEIPSFEGLVAEQELAAEPRSTASSRGEHLPKEGLKEEQKLADEKTPEASAKKEETLKHDPDRSASSAGSKGTQTPPTLPFIPKTLLETQPNLEVPEHLRNFRGQSKADGASPDSKAANASTPASSPHHRMKGRSTVPMLKASNDSLPAEKTAKSPIDKTPAGTVAPEEGSHVTKDSRANLSPQQGPANRGQPPSISTGADAPQFSPPGASYSPEAETGEPASAQNQSSAEETVLSSLQQPHHSDLDIPELPDDLAAEFQAMEPAESGPLPEQAGDEGIHHDLDAQKRDSQKTVVVERKPTRPSSFIQEKPEVISTPDRSPAADSDSDEEILDVAPRKNAFGGGPTPTSSISWEHFDNQIDQSLFPRMQQIAEVLRNSPELHRSQQHRAEQPDPEVLSDFNLRHFRLTPRAAFPQPQSPEDPPVSKDHTGTILDLLSRLRHEVIRKQTGGKAEPVRIAQPVMPGITAQEKNTKMPDPTGTFYMPRGANAKIPGKGSIKRQLHEIRRALPAAAPHPGKTSHEPQTISTQPSPSNPLRVNRDEAIQELVQVLRDHLPAPPLHTAAQQLDLQFSSTRFGNLSITLQHQNDRLEIVLQSSQEQTQQELMQSREELARQLRQLGYQQVQIQVLSRDPRQGGSNPRSGHQSAAGDSDDDRRIRFVDEDGNELDEDV